MPSSSIKFKVQGSALLCHHDPLCKPVSNVSLCVELLKKHYLTLKDCYSRYIENTNLHERLIILNYCIYSSFKKSFKLM